MRWPVAMALLLWAPPAVAEIEKFAAPTEAGFDLRWWPRLPEIDGWQQDVAQSNVYSVNIWTPVGRVAADADAVIYGKAVFREGGVTLADFMRDDIAAFRIARPELSIVPEASLTDAAGRVFHVVRYTPFVDEAGPRSNFEIVAYAEEREITEQGAVNDYIVVFCLSARSAAAFEASLPVFRDMVSRYR